MNNIVWFPARKYGWGWGLPLTWQGWVTYALAAVALLAGVPMIRRVAGGPWASIFALAVVGALVAVCYSKGEPPRWRWGE